MSTKRILIVDDEPKVAFFFQKNLEMVDKDYQVKAVNSGSEALVEIQANSFDLIITDLRMPGMNGLELLRQVRQISPQTQTILVTAFGGHSVWREADQLQVFRSLSKPLKIPELVTSVREALAQKNKLPNEDVVVMSGESFEAIARRLETLRVDVGAHAMVLADTTGHVLVETGMIPKLDISSTLALLGGIMAASSALTEQLHYPQTVHLTYYEGPPYDLYIVSLGKHFFLTIFFDRRQSVSIPSRIGIVWLYTRRILDELLELLGRRPAGQMALDRDFADSLRGELDSLFAEAPAAKPTPPVQKVTAVHTTADLHGKVESLLQLFQTQTKIVVNQELDGLDVPLNQMEGALILKLVRESLKNVLRYAQAKAVTVSFKSDEQMLRGRIQDDGIGYDPVKTSLKSLAHLQTELATLGGELKVTSRPNAGVQLLFTLPLAN
ncbi:MAG TPA: response regulator [Chloroflexota bacterium]|nr:response regulator [Chloroflexota bacterium]